MNFDEYFDLIRECGGITSFNKVIDSYYRGYGQKHKDIEIVSELPTNIPNNIFLKIINGLKPRHGAIGRLLSFGDKKTFILIFDDKNTKTVEMPYYDVIRDKTAIETKWVYKTISKNNQPKPDVKINKYGQELSVGSLLVGTPYGSSKGIIIFGRVSRWTAASVFINPMELGDGASKKISNKLKGDVRLYNYSETYVLPEEGEDLSESFVLTKLSNM